MSALAGTATDVLHRMYWTMEVHTDQAAAALDVIEAELLRRGVPLRRADGVHRRGHPGCDGVGVCSWCGQEVAGGHLCEAMCDNIDAVLTLEHFRKELFT